MSEAEAGALPVKRLRPDAVLPARAHSGDAGFDLVAVDAVEILPGRRNAVPTGIAIAIPQGHAGFVLPRSGLARTHGITLVNAPGLIDSGYRGELIVTVINHGTETFCVAAGDRIAQLVIVPISMAPASEVDELPDADDDRGEGGFGSSGR